VVVISSANVGSAGQSSTFNYLILLVLLVLLLIAFFLGYRYYRGRDVKGNEKMNALQNLGAIQNNDGEVIPDDGDCVEWVQGHKFLFSEDEKDQTDAPDRNKVRKIDLFAI
jgi:hypothetical protein